MDTEQRDLFELAGLNSSEPAPLLHLAAGLGLTVEPARHIGVDGVRVDDHIRIRYGIPRERQRFALAHEIAEWHMRNVVDSRIEEMVNQLAAALIAPRRAFLQMVNALGAMSWCELARVFGTTPSCMALRTGEAMGISLVVVAPDTVRVRGSDWGCPCAEKIRRLVRRPDVLASLGLQVVDIGGRRLVIVARAL